VIEELFSDLDKAQENISAILEKLETRKSILLHKAFTGELTAKWRVENGVRVDSWVKYNYADLGTSKLGKMLDKAKNKGTTTPYLRNINVRWFDFDLSDISTMLANEDEIKALSVKRGDLFICEGGEPGRCAIWKDVDSNLIFQKALHRFRPNDKVISEILCFYLYYLNLNGTLQNYFTGTTIKHLTGQSLAKIEVLLPTLNEQAEIVRVLDAFFEEEKRMKECLQSLQEKIALRKKSILAEAFRGKLGTNDPNEQSAVELLKEILNKG